MAKKEPGSMVEDRVERRNAERVYVRELPGGGFVAIEVSPLHGWASLWGRTRFRGEVIIERRVEAARRSGHVAPAIVVAEAESASELMKELLPIAMSNVELAARVLERQRPRATT